MKLRSLFSSSTSTLAPSRVVSAEPSETAEEPSKQQSASPSSPENSNNYGVQSFFSSVFGSQQQTSLGSSPSNRSPTGGADPNGAKLALETCSNSPKTLDGNSSFATTKSSPTNNSNSAKQPGPRGSDPEIMQVDTQGSKNLSQLPSNLSASGSDDDSDADTLSQGSQTPVVEFAAKSPKNNQQYNTAATSSSSSGGGGLSSSGLPVNQGVYSVYKQGPSTPGSAREPPPRSAPQQRYGGQQSLPPTTAGVSGSVPPREANKLVDQDPRRQQQQQQQQQHLLQQATKPPARPSGGRPYVPQTQEELVALCHQRAQMQAEQAAAALAKHNVNFRNGGGNPTSGAQQQLTPQQQYQLRQQQMQTRGAQPAPVAGSQRLQTTGTTTGTGYRAFGSPAEQTVSEMHASPRSPAESPNTINSTASGSTNSSVSPHNHRNEGHGTTTTQGRQLVASAAQSSKSVTPEQDHLSRTSTQNGEANVQSPTRHNNNNNNIAHHDLLTGITNKPTRVRKVGVDDFVLMKVLGKGSYGKVMLVKSKFDQNLYAMKMLRKDNIVRRHQVNHTRTERAVLESIRHPFIVELYYAFQSPQKLFFVMEYCPGGELFFHLSRAGRFSEPRARFYACEIILALEHLHKLDIVYRDLKPENVLLDAEGHVRVTDFGLSKENVQDNVSATSLCGTPEYLAPEILTQQGHGKAVDWWSLGALIFEMMTGLPPFYNREREKLFDNIQHAELRYPSYISPSAKSLLVRLFERQPNLRLGAGPGDAEEVKSHPFFGSVDWQAVYERRMIPPFQPSLRSNLDDQYFDREFVRLPVTNSEVPDSVLGGDPATNNLFQGFTYDQRDHEGLLNPVIMEENNGMY